MSETSHRRPTVAVVGASSDRRKFGNKCVRAYLAAGYEVFPVHPTEPVVEGLKAYKSILEVPHEKLDRVSVYLPPAVSVGLMEQVARKTVGEVWLNPGADGVAVIDKAKDLGLNVICDCSIVDIGMSPGMFPDA